MNSQNLSPIITSSHNCLDLVASIHIDQFVAPSHHNKENKEWLSIEVSYFSLPDYLQNDSL